MLSPSQSSISYSTKLSQYGQRKESCKTKCPDHRHGSRPGHQHPPYLLITSRRRSPRICQLSHHHLLRRSQQGRPPKNRHAYPSLALRAIRVAIPRQRRVSFCFPFLSPFPPPPVPNNGSSLSYAGVMGLQSDTGTSSAQYAWLGSIYYVGYILAVPLHNRLMQRFPPAKYIAVCMMLWGVVLCCMAACTTWSGLMVQRTALGSLEASVNCGFTLVTAAWWRKYEQAGRVGAWSACVGVSGILGGAVAYASVAGWEAHPDAKVEAWKILALCTGALSVIYGAGMFWWMAGSVLTAKWLNEEERKVAVERLRGNHGGVGSRVYKRYQVKEAWVDYRVSVSFTSLLTFCCFYSLPFFRLPFF